MVEVTGVRRHGADPPTLGPRQGFGVLARYALLVLLAGVLPAGRRDA